MLVERASRRIAKEFGFELKRMIAPGPAALNLIAQSREKLRQATPETYSFLSFCLQHLMLSRSQILQDLFALYETGSKRGGYFVEFGATDGTTNSNSYMLETEFGWSGIVAEPARAWHPALDSQRNCVIDHRCVTDRTGDTLTFNEAPELELSTIENYASKDRYADMRKRGTRYPVETVSLNDLLAQNDAPEGFDYLSVDTEGSELSILTAFDIDRYRPRIITVEHNFSSQREPLYELLTGKGYVRKFADLSQMDDWYVRAD